MSDVVSEPKRLCTSMDRGDDETCAIVRLNDFCLLQIFNQLYLDDLYNATDVNHQFRRVSKMWFAARYATFATFDFPHSSVLFKAQLRRVLCKFGDLIKSMHWFESPSYPIDLEALSKYCAGTMDELYLIAKMYLNCVNCAPLFSTLKTLTLDCTGFKGKARRLFSVCQELKTLRLARVLFTYPPGCISEVAQKYRKLEELCIGRDAILSAESIYTLLEMNRHIRKLDMCDNEVNKTIYKIVSKMNSLEELVLRHGHKRRQSNNVIKLAGLKSLKVLELHGEAPDFLAAIEAMENVPLERFKWMKCPSDLQFTNRISKLKSLKSLTLTGVSLPFDDCLAELSEQLPLLQELELGFECPVEPVLSISCLIKLVERSPKLDALIIRTEYPELFNQQFYDALLDVFRRRRSSSSSKTFTVTIHCPDVTSLRMDSNLLRMDSNLLRMDSNLLRVNFVESEYYSPDEWWY